MSRLRIVPDAGVTASLWTRIRVVILAIMVAVLVSAIFVIARAMIFSAERPNLRDRAPALDAASSMSEPAEPVTQAVNAFAAFTLEQSAARGPVFSARYTAEGLRLLATVVEALVLRDSLVRDSHAVIPSQMRAEAYRLEHASELMSSVTTTRAVFIAAAEFLTVAQRKKYPHLEQATTRLRDAARSIRLNQPLREQSAEIEVFFQRASDALQGMTAETS